MSARNLPRPWTDAEVAKLREFADRGLSATAIAEALKRVKSSVDGKARSMGLVLAKTMYAPSSERGIYPQIDPWPAHVRFDSLKMKPAIGRKSAAGMESQ